MHKQISMLLVCPAVLLGVAVMFVQGVSPLLWGQQLAALLIFSLLSLIRLSRRKIPAVVCAAALVLVLAATFLFPSVGGAKRWLDLGIFSINAAMLVLPGLLVLLGGTNHVFPFVIISAAILCFQPDFSQLTAFGLGVLPIVWQQRKKTFWFIVTLGFLIVCALRCAVTPVSLETVAYCEGILGAAGLLSPWLQAAGLLTLALVPVSFAWQAYRRHRTAFLCLAVYYAAMMLFSGQYPVPFMGFGLSPIAGCCMALILSRDASSSPNA